MTQLELNRYLMSLLGSEDFVNRWWHSPNAKFNFADPYEVWSSGPEGQNEVESYVLEHCYGGYH